jgi:segregation and condensation protein B
VVRLFPVPGAADREGGAVHLRTLEAILFASSEPVPEGELRKRLPESADCGALLTELQRFYAARGVNLVKVAGGWAFRTAPDLVAALMTREIVEQRRLSRAALEMLAIIAYHQPVTRTEIEEIRGVVTGKGTLDLLIEIGWVRIAGRRRVPGRPVTYGTTDAFLEHFGLDRVSDLPGLDELAAAGLLEKNFTRLPAELDPLGGDADDDQGDDDADDQGDDDADGPDQDGDADRGYLEGDREDEAGA